MSYSKKIKIAMLVNNPATHDARVIKYAESLAEQGYDITLLCRSSGQESAIEEKNGVQYQRHLFIWKLDTVLKKASLFFIKNPKALVAIPKKSLLCLFFLSPFVLTSSLFLMMIKPLNKKNKKSFIKRTFGYAFNHVFQSFFLSIENFVSLCEPLRQLDPDIIHAHDLDTLTVAAFVARTNAIPYIYDAHEYEQDRNDRPGRINQFFIKNEEKKHIKKASVITVSQGIADLLAQNYKIPRPLVVYNVPKISQSRSLISSNHIRQALGLKLTDIIIVYVGLITVDRCLENMVQALEHTTNIHLACVGPQHQPMVDKLNLLAEKLDRQTYFHVLPPVPSQQVSEFISSANMGIAIFDDLCTSYEHVMPNKFFEMLLAGLPLIVSHQAEMRAFIHKYNNGVVLNENSPLKIAQGIQQLASNQEKLKPTPEKIDYLSQTYSWQAQEKNILELYQTLSKGLRPQVSCK